MSLTKRSAPEKKALEKKYLPLKVHIILRYSILLVFVRFIWWYFRHLNHISHYNFLSFVFEKLFLRMLISVYADEWLLNFNLGNVLLDNLTNPF